MEDILLNQVRYHRLISESNEKLVRSAKGAITLGAVEARLSSLEKYKMLFDAGHEALLSKHRETLQTSTYWLDDQYERTEEEYIVQKGLLLDHKASVSRMVETPPQVQHSKSQIRSLQLPTFDGKYEEWTAFKDLFCSIIDREEGLSRIEKLQHLKVSLHGEALALVRDIPTTETNYARTWKILTDHYENQRIMVSLALSKLSTITKMKSESVSDLSQIFLTITSMVNAMEGIGRPIGSTEDLLVYIVVEFFDFHTRKEWEMATNATSDPPTWETLRTFMDRHIQALQKGSSLRPDASSSRSEASFSRKSTEQAAHTHGRQPPRKVHTHQGSADSGRCIHCKGEHPLMLCETYKKKTCLERRKMVEHFRLCFNCLGSHLSKFCQSPRTCFKCHGKHHTTLHDAFAAPSTTTSSTSEVGVPEQRGSTSAHQSSGQAASVLLATARVLVADKHGRYQTARALPDQGSETSMVTERLAQRLHLTRASASVAIFGIGGVQTGVARGKVPLKLRSLSGHEDVHTQALVMPRLSVYATKLQDSMKVWTHLEGLTLADPTYFHDDPIDILLGADVYGTILRAGLRKGKVGEPIAQSTSFGWILSGRMRETTEAQVSSLQCTLGDPLSAVVRAFWEQEEVKTCEHIETEEERLCEQHFRSTHSRTKEGRYVVRLPFKSSPCTVLKTKGNALRALLQGERRFLRNPELHASYSEFMDQYESLHHMTQVEPMQDDEGLAYLPHHGVLRETSTTTRLRVVFNGSSKSYTGTSLNEQLLTGPNLLPSLADVLLKWRMHQYVMVTDIEKMYRQILVDSQDRNWQRILWRRHPENEVAEYQLNTVTYGMACAPFLAIRTIKQLAEDEASAFPLGAKALQSDVYVDDILTGAGSEEQLLKLKSELIELCKAGGFPLQKWASNSRKLMDSIPRTENQAAKAVSLSDGQDTHLTLGLQWHPSTDDFSFSVKPAVLTSITRRTILSQAAQLFDPLGWLTPVTVRAKIYIQNTWLLKIDWDAPLPESLTKKWLEFRQQWGTLTSLHLPRPVTLGSSGTYELLGFCDASEQAFAAVLYLKHTLNSITHQISLLTAKSKVAPIKQVSLPRLELCAAVLLVRLTDRCKSILGLDDVPIHFWSDSTVALGWIHGHPNKWKTYVANRVSEVQRTLPDAHWHHVAGTENPADCASRGISPEKLLNHPLWWHGPPFLQEDNFDSTIEEPEEELPEQRERNALGVTTKDNPENPIVERFSTYLRLLRVSAWCRRWLPKGRRVPLTCSNSGCLSVAELNAAELAWIRVAQSSVFKSEILAVEGHQGVPSRSPLASLTPFLDQDGLLRVGGRLAFASLLRDQKHPIILPPSVKVTTLLVKEHHKRTLHGGTQLTLGSIRQRFWIPQGRRLVKSVIKECVTCTRWRAETPTTLMGSLPFSRVNPARPFQFTGVDYAGPYHLRTTAGRGHKSYKGFLVVFVCLSTKAVHLDVASSYSSDAFISVLKRFISRRGLCSELFSDQGTNFVGADAELQRMFRASSLEFKEWADFLSTMRIKWRFNPPGAPHFGGLWEAAVKSTKHHLRRCLGSHTLTFEEMSTLLTQVEACLNSRPLCSLTDDPDDLQALTPGHFLVGSALNALPEPSLLDTNISRLSRWQLISQMRDSFWKNWAAEYLQGLAPRSKWRTSSEKILPGRLCLLKHDSTPPSSWPLARITEVHPGKDEHVRVVTVKTATSIFQRPIAKLALLPVSDSVSPQSL